MAAIHSSGRRSERTRSAAPARAAQTNALPAGFAARVLEGLSEGVMTIDLSYRVTALNRAAAIMIGIAPEDAIGRPCRDVFRSDMCGHNCAMRRTLAKAETCCDVATCFTDSAGRQIPVTVTTDLLRDADANVVGGIKTFRDLSRLEKLRNGERDRSRVGRLVTHSPTMQKLFAILPKVAECDCSVFIYGETGTGKEVLARTIHHLSPRRGSPFVAIDCGALPNNLLESELFGHKAGAFTGAVTDRDGYFARARGGTVFLDEMDEVSPDLQARLLRVLQERTFSPLGSAEVIRTDVRIIVAAKQDPAVLMARGSLRHDLFYRFNVMRLNLPPLCCRREDIPSLAEQFIVRYNAHHGAAVSGMSPEVLSQLSAHDFPGNVRELENIVQHAVVIRRIGQLQLQDLPESLQHLAAAADSPATPEPAPAERPSLRAAEAVAIREALARHHGNRDAAARALGIHRTTLYRKMARLGIDLPETDGRTRPVDPPDWQI